MLNFIKCGALENETGDIRGKARGLGTEDIYHSDRVLLFYLREQRKYEIN